MTQLKKKFQTFELLKPLLILSYMKKFEEFFQESSEKWESIIPKAYLFYGFVVRTVVYIQFSLSLMTLEKNVHAFSQGGSLYNHVTLFNHKDTPSPSNPRSHPWRICRNYSVTRAQIQSPSTIVIFISPQN